MTVVSLPAVGSPPGPVTDGRGATSRKGWTLALASFGVFLTSLDVVVVATALPTLTTDLHASLSQLEWTINAYNLVFACLMLISRMAQGVGAAAILPLTLTLISEAFPLAKRGAAIGIWGGVSGLGVAAGPVLGGAIVEGLSWQWIFWINVPVGAVVAVLSALRLRESRGPRPRLDITGLVLVGLGLASLTWAAVRAPEVGWGSSEVVGTLIAGVVLPGAFLSWERRTTHPMLPLAYFRSRGFSSANGVAIFQFISLLGSLFMITQLFQIGLGYSPLEAGLRILVWMAMPMLVAPIAGGLADRFGNKPFMLLGLLLQGAGLGWLALVVEPGVGYGSLVVPLIIAGIGISWCFPTVANAVVSSVPLGDSGVAAGTNSALRELGGVFGIAILAAVFAGNGGYSSPAAFIDGFKPAIAVAALVPVLGLVAAAAGPSRRQVRELHPSAPRDIQQELTS